MYLPQQLSVVSQARQSFGCYMQIGFCGSRRNIYSTNQIIIIIVFSFHVHIGHMISTFTKEQEEIFKLDFCKGMHKHPTTTPCLSLISVHNTD